jgi:opacity protein-like surface antigen
VTKFVAYHRAALLYGTAGVDFLRSESAINCTLAGACKAVGVPVAASGSTTRTGWVAGGGAQFFLAAIGLGPNWQGQIEYLHADFGTFDARLARNVPDHGQLEAPTP